FDHQRSGAWELSAFVVDCRHRKEQTISNEPKAAGNCSQSVIIEISEGGLNAMFITKRHIPRRTFLRGVGVSVALPFLESMLPAQTPLAKATASAPKARFVGIWAPHGWAPTYWSGTMAGSETSKSGDAFKLGSIHT